MYKSVRVFYKRVKVYQLFSLAYTLNKINHLYVASLTLLSWLESSAHLKSIHATNFNLDNNPFDENNLDVS